MSSLGKRPRDDEFDEVVHPMTLLKEPSAKRGKHGHADTVELMEVATAKEAERSLPHCDSSTSSKSPEAGAEPVGAHIGAASTVKEAVLPAALADALPKVMVPLKVPDQEIASVEDAVIDAKDIDAASPRALSPTPREMSQGSSELIAQSAESTVLPKAPDREIVSVKTAAVDPTYPNASRPPVRIIRSTTRPLFSNTNPDGGATQFPTPSPTPASSSPPQSHATNPQTPDKAASDRKVMYQNTPVQTLPPGDVVEFERVFGFPAADGISGNIPRGIKVKGWTGLGAMGRFQERTGCKYDLVYGAEYQAPPTSSTNVEDHGFQTMDFQTRNMAKAKAKAKSVIQAKNLQPWMDRQGMIARPETRGYMIVHSEQFQVKVKVDQDGMVDGAIKAPFPNVVCKDQTDPAICLPEHEDNSPPSHHRSPEVEVPKSTQASSPSALVNTMKDQADAGVQAHDSTNSPKPNVENKLPQEKEGTQPVAPPQPLLRSTSQEKTPPYFTNSNVPTTSAPSPNSKKRDRDDFLEDQVDWSDSELIPTPKKQRQTGHEEPELNIRGAAHAQNAGLIKGQASVESQGGTQFQNVDRIEEEASRKSQDKPKETSQRSAGRGAFRPQGVWIPSFRR